MKQALVLGIVGRLELRLCQRRVGAVLELRPALVDHGGEELRLGLAVDDGGVLQMLVIRLR